MTERAPGAVIAALESDLAIARALLVSDDRDAVDAAGKLLAGVDAALGQLVSDVDADTETARRLLSVRADLSGHLLAAGALDSAGAHMGVAARMLRRAAGKALEGLEEGELDRSPVGAGRH
jgi:hypothetical protein